MEDNTIIPFETRVYFSKQKLKKSIRLCLIFSVLVPLITIIVGLKFIPFYFFGVFSLVFIGAIYVDLRKKSKNEKPQILLNEDGLETVQTSFFAWKDIFEEDVETISRNRTTGDYLTYRYTKGSKVEFPLYLLDTSKEDLKKLLRTYRKRNSERFKDLN